MPLTLKSNRISSASVGNVHDYTGPLDYKAMLDFNRDEYYTMIGGVRQDYTLAQAVVTTRSTTGEYRDVDSTYKTVAANLPRLHYMPDLGLRGLMSEPSRKNLVATPTSPPASQSVTVDSGSTAQRIMLRVWGSGDATLTATELTLESEITVTDGKVKAYTRSVSSAFTATLAVTGTVDRVQAELGAAAAAASSFYAGTRGLETTVLGSDFATLLGAGGTIAAHYIAPQTPVTGSSFTSGLLSIQNSGAGLGGLHITTSQPRSGTSNGTNNLVSLASGGAANSGTTRASLTGPYSRQQVAGIGFSGDDLSLIHSSQAVQAVDTGYTLGATADKITIAGGPAINSSAGAFLGIVARVVIYDRFLTADELRRVAGTWIA